MDINRRKTGLGRLIEIAGTKRWLLIGAMSLAVITAIVQFVPIIAVYNILIELAKHAIEPSMIDQGLHLAMGLYSLGGFPRIRGTDLCISYAFAHCRFQHSVRNTDAVGTKDGTPAFGVL